MPLNTRDLKAIDYIYISTDTGYTTIEITCRREDLIAYPDGDVGNDFANIARQLNPDWKLCPALNARKAAECVYEAFLGTNAVCVGTREEQIEEIVRLIEESGSGGDE